MSFTYAVSFAVSKWELFFIRSGIKVNGRHCWDILLSQQTLRAIKRFVDNIVPFSNTVYRCILCSTQPRQHSLTAAVQNSQLPFS